MLTRRAKAYISSSSVV